MSMTHRAARSALVVAGMMSLVSASSALAQRSEKRYGFGAPPAPPSQPTTPYPGATVTIDPRWYPMEQAPPVPPPLMDEFDRELAEGKMPGQ